jgi:hypothetical protein
MRSLIVLVGLTEATLALTREGTHAVTVLILPAALLGEVFPGGVLRIAPFAEGGSAHYGCTEKVNAV